LKERDMSIGVGLIGTGYMGKCHALAWSAVKAVFADVPDITLAHLGEVDDGMARRRAEEFGFQHSSGNWRDVIEDQAVDMVSITTPQQLPRRNDFCRP
jgi:predicted dehydrogenase